MFVVPFFVGLSIMSLYVEGVCIAYSLFVIYFIILLCLISVIFKKISAKDTMSLSTSVCWFVGLSPGSHKNFPTDFHQTGMDDGSRPRKDPANFWCGCE